MSKLRRDISVALDGPGLLSCMALILKAASKRSYHIGRHDPGTLGSGSRGSVSPDGRVG
jgi:hypothetical protein